MGLAALDPPYRLPVLVSQFLNLGGGEGFAVDPHVGNSPWKNRPLW